MEYYNIINGVIHGVIHGPMSKETNQLRIYAVF